MFLTTVHVPAADPQLTSWFTVNSGKVARIYRTDADRAAGQSVTTWSNGRQIQAHPAYRGVQQILVSSNWIYIRSTGLGSQVMDCARVRKLIDQHGETFLKQVYTDREVQFCNGKSRTTEQFTALWAAKEAVFQHTDKRRAPWWVIKSNDKKRARLNAIRTFLNQFDYYEKDTTVVRPPDPLIVTRAKKTVEE